MGDIMAEQAKRDNQRLEFLERFHKIITEQEIKFTPDLIVAAYIPDTNLISFNLPETLFLNAKAWAALNGIGEYYEGKIASEMQLTKIHRHVVSLIQKVLKEGQAIYIS